MGDAALGQASQLDLRQGDYLPANPRLVVLGQNGQGAVVSTPLGVVLVSQCCDLARGGTGHAHVAPVVPLPDDTAALALQGRMPRYVPLPHVGEDRFADLGTIGAVTASHLNREQLARASQAQRRKIGYLVGRRFGRFAFPDDLNPMLSHLRSRIRGKAGNENSAVGRVLERVSTLRLEVDEGWEAEPPWSLRLLIIVALDELPTLEEDAGVAIGAPRPLTQVAQALDTAPAGTLLALRLWEEFGAALALDCRSKAGPVVSDLDYEVISEDEFRYSRFRRTEDVDLDDLSLASSESAAIPMSTPQPGGQPRKLSLLQRVRGFVRGG